MSFLGDLFNSEVMRYHTTPWGGFGFGAGDSKKPGAIDQPPQKPANPDAALARKIPAEPATQSTPLGQASLLGGGSTTGIY